MTLETFTNQLRDILEDFYALDSGWRHDPLWLRVKALQQRAQAAVDQQQDDANQEAFEEWQASRAKQPDIGVTQVQNRSNGTCASAAGYPGHQRRGNFTRCGGGPKTSDRS